VFELKSISKKLCAISGLNHGRETACFAAALFMGQWRAMPVATALIHPRSTHFADIRFDLSRAPRLGNNHPVRTLPETASGTPSLAVRL